MTTQTDEEFKAECVARMGQDLGEAYHLLWRDVTEIHIKWIEFRELFATSESRFDLMNATAPAFFMRLQDTLWNEVILNLCLLTDKPAPYLTVHRLLSALPPGHDLRPLVSAALDEVETATRFARDWRDRRLAHRDFAHARDPKIRPLKSASREGTEAAIAGLRRVMNLVGAHFGEADIQYAGAIQALGGASNLLWYLDSGREAEEARRESRVFGWKPRHLRDGDGK
jgi:HEPN superfamily AbiU2-like protein